MRIGDSDLDVARIGFGGNVLGWTADEATSHALLDAYAEAGGNFIDTADGYSHWASGNRGGESEAVIGSWLRARGHHDDLVIATKVSTKPDRKGLAPNNVRLAVDESLERLGVEAIDLYYAHFDDPGVPLAETVAVFEEIRAAGKIRHVGLSNYAPERIEEWMALAAEQGAAAPVALQPHYNLVRRGDVEGPGGRGEVAARHGLSLVPYFSLAAGFLAGKYRRDEAPTGDRAGMVADYLRPECFDVVDAVVEIAAAHGVEPASVALAWLRDRPGVVAPLASARSLAQLPAITAALDLALAPEEADRLTRLSDAIA
ncbi:MULTISPECIES: aldo/keto reductase [Actinomyces]|uniref:Aldo/keto reductase n=1 Tax=Actinomyces marmotae TaxID=2737173 RepID=A0A6M8B152_9ACTO|nr:MULTISPECIES: aldo/keto reductase [Actinomyces]QKD79482.1 aldo/keto reductase [Actinomyces marmotae]